jgi:tRNA dimethylallyltransferase
LWAKVIRWISVSACYVIVSSDPSEIVDSSGIAANWRSGPSIQLEGAVLAKSWFLAGPTACGKSAAACELALRIGAEIISLDSMSIYRGMDIGTAKPTPAQQSQVPHHLIDILDPHEEYSLAEYVTHADRVAKEIVARGRIPLFVGGTGLYLRGILRGVFAGPPANLDIRRELEQLAAEQGNPAVHAQLAAIDPDLAGKLSPADLRRVIRGIEVYRLTGERLSAQQNQGPRPESERPRHVFWLSPPRDWLYDRINRRVDEMFRDGLVAEVGRLMDRTPPLGKTASQALGYKEVIEGLAEGKSLLEIKNLIQTRSRQFAKRQHTWFRNLVECRAISINGTETPAAIADQLSQIS